MWHPCPVIASRNTVRKQAWVAAVGGSLISASLCAFSWQYSDPIEFLWWPPFLRWPQFVGFVGGIMLGGDPFSRVRIAAVTIAINALIYALAVFCVMRVIARRRDFA
jgi:peptidoglycan/LPS O-acetylase OafA/YrhL